LSDRLKEGDLFGLQMRDGIVQKVGDSNTTFAAIGTPAGFEDFTKGLMERSYRGKKCSGNV
jgi:hypothetical protein